MTCKNRYHRKMRRAQATVRQTIDNFLHRNHTILYELMLEHNAKKIKISRVKLQKAGFRFSNYTGSYLNRQGKTYYHVYDYSWMAFSDNQVLIVRR